MPTSERLFYFVCGALLLLGGVLFLWGGSQHPATGTNLGVVGSEEFFREFALHIVQHPAWERIHTGILVGPLFWALGGVGACAALRHFDEVRFSTLGAVALAMGATAWVVTFVFDGFVALPYAEAISANSQGDMTPIVTGFQASQVVVIRLALVSWILIGWAMAAFGVSILAAKMHSRTFKGLLGASGLLLGAWPTIAWATGVFEPGPFVSGLWVPTALLTAAWFMSLGIAIVAQATRATTSGEPAGE